jgi:membrane protein involved in colicin uptake
MIQDAEKRRQEDLKRKAEQEAKQKADDEARRKAAEDAERKRQQEELRVKAEAEAKKKAEEDAKRKEENDLKALLDRAKSECVCTSVISAKPFKQPYFFCQTCNLTESKAMCIVCKDICHKVFVAVIFPVNTFAFVIFLDSFSF